LLTRNGRFIRAIARQIALDASYHLVFSSLDLGKYGRSYDHFSGLAMLGTTTPQGPHGVSAHGLSESRPDLSHSIFMAHRHYTIGSKSYGKPWFRICIPWSTCKTLKIGGGGTMPREVRCTYAMEWGQSALHWLLGAPRMGRFDFDHAWLHGAKRWCYLGLHKARSSITTLVGAHKAAWGWWSCAIRWVGASHSQWRAS